MSGTFAGALTAFRTVLAAACINGEFLPVTIRPSFSSMAAPQKMPSLPFSRACALRGLVRGAHRHAVQDRRALFFQIPFVVEADACRHRCPPHLEYAD